MTARFTCTSSSVSLPLRNSRPAFGPPTEMSPPAPTETRELAARKHRLHEACCRIAAFAILILMRPRAIPGLALLGVLVWGVAARADEFRLKDGTKISGTIVGYENDSFKVETAFGF